MSCGDGQVCTESGQCAECVPGARRCTVLRLRAMLAAVDDEDAVAGQPTAGERDQAMLHVIGQRRGADVEAKLHGGCHFVDVLAAGPGCANEALLDFAFFDRDRIGDAEHRPMIRVCMAETALS